MVKWLTFKEAQKIQVELFLVGNPLFNESTGNQAFEEIGVILPKDR